MRKIIPLFCGTLLAVSGFAEPGKLTLEQALTRARIHSPELKAARLQTKAAEQAIAASGRWANPVFSFEAEGIGGNLDGVSDTEYTVALKQTFQRGGKQKSSRAVAEKSVGIAFQVEAEKEMALLAEVRLAFIEVFAQQEVSLVRVEQEQLGRAFVAVAERRYAAGGASELDVVQAELLLEEILLAQTCCFGDLKAARVKLASLVGLAESLLPELEGTYYDLQTLEDSLIADSHPSLQRLNAAIEVTRARAVQARAQDAADITLGVGYRYEAASDEGSFLFGASMPLSFSRPGRAIEAATLIQVDALRAEGEELRRKLQQQLSVLVAVYSGAKLEAEMTRDRLMPKAKKAYQLSKNGYDAGRFSWFELITAQQHLADIRVRQIDALKEAHIARAEVSRFMKKGI
ncbi:MAG: TolC family protein [Pontiella sp.]